MLSDSDSILRIEPWPLQRGADLAARFTERRPQPLPGHFQKTKPGDAAKLNPCTVKLQGLAYTLFDFALVTVRRHVDEVDHDQAADIPQAQLAGNFVRGFQVGLQRRFFNIAATGGP